MATVNSTTRQNFWSNSSAKGQTWLTFDFIGFKKMNRITKIIVVFQIKFTHILTNSHKIHIKY